MLGIDTLYGHLQINAANDDLDTHKVDLIGFSHTEELYVKWNRSSLEGEKLKNAAQAWAEDSHFYLKYSSPSRLSLLTNFGQYDNSMFWQMTTSNMLELVYDRRSNKPLYSQWNKLVGPVSLSDFDHFQFQYACFKG